MALNDAVPSSATDVFKRNAEDADRLINSIGNVTTRTGKELPSWDEIAKFHAAWNNRGAWVTATTYAVNDIWEDGGIWYVVLSAYTSGASAAADIAGPNVTVLQSKKQVIAINSVSDIAGLNGTYDDQQISLKGWHPASDVGGGILYWDAAKLKSEHDGGNVFSPTVPFDNDETIYNAATGETDPTGSGCWVRKFVGYTSEEFFGFNNKSNNVRFLKSVVSGDRAVPSEASARDAFNILRTVSGDSNCHGFADSSVVEPTDVGTYGAVDVTTTMRGDAAYDHCYAFQARHNYDGVDAGGTIANLGGMIVSKQASQGTINYDFGIKVSPTVTSTTLINNATAYEAQNRTAVATAIGYHVYQLAASAPSSYSILSNGDAKSYHKGAIATGATENQIYPHTFTQTDGAIAGWGADTGSGAYFGTTQNIPVSIYRNGQIAMKIVDNGSGESIIPRQDSTDYIGTQGATYRQVWTSEGIVVKTPDGTKYYKISVDNAGALTSTFISAV